jgi:hypothetical protein
MLIGQPSGALARSGGMSHHLKSKWLALVILLATGPGAAAHVHKQTTTAAHPSPPAKAKAYGLHCRGKSHKHVAGQKGTPFSRCVRAAHKKKERDS